MTKHALHSMIELRRDVTKLLQFTTDDVEVSGQID